MYTVWGRPDCVWCKEARKLLDYYFIKYDYIELTSENLDNFSAMTGGAKTVPQVFDKDGSYIGGYEQLKEYLK